jgi:hypothetical protein
MGKKFYQHDVPELVRQLTRIADSLEKSNKEDEIGSSFSAVNNFINQYPNDADLGKQIRQIWS